MRSMRAEPHCPARRDVARRNRSIPVDPTGSADAAEPRSGPPLVTAAADLRSAVASALRTGEFEIGEELLVQLRELAMHGWAPPAVRGELSRAVGVLHIIAWREHDTVRAHDALAELEALADDSRPGSVEREQRSRAWAREHAIADRAGQGERAAALLARLRESARTCDATELDHTLLARALQRAHRSELERAAREEAARLLFELRELARRGGGAGEKRLILARALIDAIWLAPNPGSPRSRALREECAELLDAAQPHPSVRMLRNRLP